MLKGLLYNLYGILSLAAPHHKVDPLCDVYVALFYSPLTDKTLLAAYFHKIALLFPNKMAELREVLIWMLGEVLSGDEIADDAFRIIGTILSNLHECVATFCSEEGEEDGNDPPRYLGPKLC